MSPDVQPAGNYYDKYRTANPIARRLMRGFLDAFDSLVERGWVTRHASDVDRRRIVLAITVAGQELVKNLLPQFHPKLSSFLSILSEEEKRTVALSLKKIAASLDAGARGGKS